MVSFLCFCHRLPRFYQIEQFGHFIGLQADDGLFRDLRHIHLGRHILGQQLPFIKVFEKGLEGGELSGFAGIVVFQLPVILGNIIAQVFQIPLQYGGRNGF